MALPPGFRLREGVTVVSEATGVPWRVMVAGRNYCLLQSVTLSGLTMRVPTSELRARFSQVIEVG